MLNIVVGFLKIHLCILLHKSHIPLEVMVKGSESETNEIKIRNIVENLVLYSKDVDSKSKVFLVEGPTFDAFYVPLTQA